MELPVLGSESLGLSDEQVTIAAQQSADDILNELFSELGSKEPTLGSFNDEVPVKSSKKKKKRKEKTKEKVKAVKEKKKHKGKQKQKGAKNKHCDEDNKEDDSNRQDDAPAVKKRKTKDASKVKSKSPTSHHRKSTGVDIDLEEGEIQEKKREHSHHHDEKDHEGDKVDLKQRESRKRRRHSEEESSSWSKVSAEEKSSYHHSSKRSHSKNSDYKSHRSPDYRHSDNPDYDYRRYSDRKSPDSRYSSSSKYYDSRGNHDYRQSDDREDRNYGGSRYSNNYRDDDHDRSSYRGSYSKNYDSRSSYRYRRRSKSRSPSDVIDKAKLLEIARRNATLLMKQGVLPTDIFSRDQIMAIKAGGKSVEELTSYCRRLARKDARSAGNGGDDDSGDNSGEEEHFIHHPFIVKDRPMPQITLNIRNAIPLPVRTPAEMAIENAVRKTQFPVSSGAQHRYKELEWKVVEKDDDKKEKKTKEDKNSKALVVLDSAKTVGTAIPIPKSSPPPVHSEIQECDSSSSVLVESSEKIQEKEKETDTGITLEPPMLPQVDISSVISARLKAMRALKENPESEEAKKLLDGAVEEMNQWAQAKALEPKFLTVSDLQTGPQAWAKRDQLKNAKEVASGMGMHLLQKMGWRPGEGLGKNKEGSTEPLALDVKTDKKGLTAQSDLKMKGPQANVSMLYDLAGKHPVSALMELCTKRRWGPPSFELCFEHGPPHQKQFVYKVVVNGVEYQPCIATNNKKLAKANAAAFCLQSLGLLKTNPAPGPTENLQTVPPAPVPPPEEMKLISSHLLQTVPHN